MYTYVIGFEARKKSNLSDCYSAEVNTLCDKGADFIRQNRNYILNTYDHTVSELGKIIGYLSTPIFLIEPDFWYFFF